MTTTLPPSAGPSAPSGPDDDALVQEEPRRKRDFGIDRRRLRRLRIIVFAILALPILALCLLAARFVSLPLTQAWHDDAYADKDWSAASERLGPVEALNWFEPYLPHLTHGTDLLQAGDDVGAEKELRVALETWQGSSDLNQPAHAECKILNNLAISIERQADRIEDPAARGDRLFEAETLLAPCASGGGGEGEGESQGGGGGNGNEDEGTTGDNGERIEGKRQEADREAGRDPDARGTDEGQDPPDPQEDPSNSPQQEDPSGSGPTQEAPTEGTSEDQKKQEELEQRNESANQGGDGDDSSGGASQNPDKPW